MSDGHAKPRVRLLAAIVAIASLALPRFALADPPVAPPVAPASPAVGASTPPVPVAPPDAPTTAPGDATGAGGQPSAPPASTGHWVFVQDSGKGSSATPPTVPPNAPAQASPPIRSERRPLYLRLNTWDLNIEGAGGRFFGATDAWTGFVRARAGVLFVREPLYNALGFTYEYSSLSKATFGIQGKILYLDRGVWAQAGALLDVSAHPGGMLAVGWSLFGVEAQARAYDGYGTGVALYAKVRVPVSIIARLFASHRTAVQAAPATHP